VNAIRQNDMNGIVSLVLGIALLPLAKYVWDKNLTGMK
jgi:hypothetical protein